MPSGTRIGVDDAEEHVFGLCLLNDWSARDLQAWEYQPLGPFLGKNFATTISPWIVTLEALAPFRTAWPRAPRTRSPCPIWTVNRAAQRRAPSISSSRPGCRPQRCAPRAEGRRGCRTVNFRHAYWTVAQMIAHHTVNGCNLRPGDLLGTGTQSGPDAAEAGSLLELSHGGKQPLTPADGEQRRFLEDGDEIILRGYCQRPGAARIGFGEARGRVLPAHH